MQTVHKPKRAIIIAAGMGSRLRPWTNDRPKALVEVAGKPMLLRAIENLRNVGVTEFIIIRGYKAQVFDEWRDKFGEGITFVDNTDYEKNNILQSLLKAEQYFKDEPSFYWSYADIIWAPEVTEKLANSPGDYCLVVDKDLNQIYDGRTDTPLTEGELCSLDSDGNVKKVGKCSCSVDEAVGEFIGLAKVSNDAAKKMIETFYEAETEFSDNKKKFVRATTWQNAYVCDILEYMIEKKNVKMTPVFIEGRWREIDTVQDKQLADARANY